MALNDIVLLLFRYFHLRSVCHPTFGHLFRSTRRPHSHSVFFLFRLDLRIHSIILLCVSWFNVCFYYVFSHFFLWQRKHKKKRIAMNEARERERESERWREREWDGEIGRKMRGAKSATAINKQNKHLRSRRKICARNEFPRLQYFLWYGQTNEARMRETRHLLETMMLPRNFHAVVFHSLLLLMLFRHSDSVFSYLLVQFFFRLLLATLRSLSRPPSTTSFCVFFFTFRG